MNKRYDTYKNSGVAWIGEVPEHWGVGRLKSIVHLITGVSSLDLPKVGLENIESNTGKFIQTDTVFDGDGVAFNVDDILFGKLRPYLAKVYLAKSNGLAVGDFYVFRSFNDNLPIYTFWLLISNYTISLVDGSTYGAKMPRANWEFISNIKLPIPPLPEQQAIANYLDHKTSEIDRIVSTRVRQIELLKELRTSIISRAVTKGLDPNAKMKDSGIEWIGEVPEHWETGKLKHISLVKTGYTPSMEDDENYSDEGLCWVKPDELNGFTPIHNSNSKISDKGIRISNVIPIGSVLVCCIGTIGKIGVAGTKLATNQQINSIVFKQNIDCDYGKYLVFSLEEEHNRLANGNVVKIINRDKQCSIQIIIPPLLEQQDIANYLDRKTAEINGTIGKYQSQIEKLKEYRQSLITEVVTGKVDVRGFTQFYNK